MEKTGIILEGGAMRSIFSAGVLDFFLEKRIQIQNVMAVSAGAYAAMNYVSEQKGRILDSVVMPLETEKYMGFRTFLKKGTFFDMDLLFDEIPKKRAPFDFETFSHSAKKFMINTVNCLTGESVFFDVFKDEDQFFKICRAANSLPFIADVTMVDGIPMMDGGMADAIPIDRAVKEGWDKIIVVLTRNADYRKKQRHFYIAMLRILYRKYPKFVSLVTERAARYNESLCTLKSLEEEGRAFVFRPEKNMHLTNNEARVDKLMKYYSHGYRMAEEKEGELLKFLAF